MPAPESSLWQPFPAAEGLVCISATLFSSALLDRHPKHEDALTSYSFQQYLFCFSGLTSTLKPACNEVLRRAAAMRDATGPAYNTPTKAEALTFTPAPGQDRNHHGRQLQSAGQPGQQQHPCQTGPRGRRRGASRCASGCPASCGSAHCTEQCLTVSRAKGCGSLGISWSCRRCASGSEQSSCSESKEPLAPALRK